MEKELLQAEQEVRSTVKNKLFDIITACIILAMAAISLGVLGWNNVTWKSVGQTIIKTVPYFIGAYLLGINQYEKGAWKAKATPEFKSAAIAYSQKISEYVGKKLSEMNKFCLYFNRKSLTFVRDNILVAVGLSSNEFLQGDGDRPLIAMSKKEIVERYGKTGWRAVKKARKAKIKGINSNKLLGSLDSDDPTNIGNNEATMFRNRRVGYAVKYWLTTFCFSLVVINDIFTWGWAGILYAVFKIAFIAAMSFTKYFDGYKDISVKLVTHINRKTDILKEYDDWYEQSSNSDNQIQLNI